MSTLATLKTLIRATLNEADASQWSDVDILRWINAAERDIAIKSGCIEFISALTTAPESRLVTFTGNRVNYVEYLVGGTYLYLPGGSTVWTDTPDNVFQDTPDTVWTDTVDTLWLAYPGTALQRIAPHQLGHLKCRGLITPQFWFQWGNKLVIEPRPTTAYNLNVYGSTNPSNQMSLSTDEPEIPDEFQQAIIPYACMMAKFQAKRYSEFIIYYNSYLSALQDLIKGYAVREKMKRINLRTPSLTREKRKKNIVTVTGEVREGTVQE